MDNKYKIFVVNRLYGLIEGSPKSLKYMLLSDFKARYNFEPDSITVISSNIYILEEYMNGCWIGTMTVRLVIDGEEWLITRDWGEEYKYDFSHPNFKTDDWFYESEDCYSYKKYNEILATLV